MVRPRTLVPAPPVTPRPFGLLSVAVGPLELTGPALLGLHYEPAACGDVYETAGACQDAAFDPDNTHEGVPLVEGDPFTLYSLFQCNPVGLGAERLRELAGESLRTGESRGVEHGVADRLPLAAGAVDLTPTPGTAVHPVDGLAILEGWSAQNYGGVPVMHATPGIVTVLGSLGSVERQSNGAASGLHLETKQGSLVASGGGYYELQGPPTDSADPATIQAAGAGEAWLYVTGTVVVWRNPTPDVTPLIMDRAVGGDSGLASNDALVMASRAYVAAWECVTGAVLVTSPYAVPA